MPWEERKIIIVGRKQAKQEKKTKRSNLKKFRKRKEKEKVIMQ